MGSARLADHGDPGCRRGELCALRWRDLNVDRGQLWVSRSAAQPKSGIKEKSTKTDGQRRIGIDPHTLELLAEHRAAVEGRLDQLGVRFTPDAFMFSSTPDHSAPLAPRSVSQRYRRMATRLGLRSTRLHSLRHYSATELLAAGVDLRTVTGRLGHGGGGATTLKVYAAWVDQADRKAATTIASILPTPVPTFAPPRGPYATIAEALRADIAEGRLRPGDQLPTVVQLAAQYTVAAGTLATDLLAWLRHLTLDGDLARAEPKTLRYRLLHTAARITHGQRIRWLNIPPTWPWAHTLATIFTRIQALPAPT